MPVTDSTINGVNEADDDVNEVGGYLQWESALSRQLDLVLAPAGRAMDNTRVYRVTCRIVFGLRPEKP